MHPKQSVIVTDHAKEQILARFRCNPRKVQKVADKAWVAPLASHKHSWQRQKSYPHSIMKELMGYVFCFVVDAQSPFPRLITVIAIRGSGVMKRNLR